MTPIIFVAVLFALVAGYVILKRRTSGVAGSQVADTAAAQRKYLLIILRRSPAKLRADTLEAAARSAWGHFGRNDTSRYVDRGVSDVMFVMQAHGNAFSLIASQKSDRKLDEPTTFVPPESSSVWKNYSHDLSIGVAHAYDSSPAKLAAYVGTLCARLCDGDSLALIHPASRRLWQLNKGVIEQLQNDPRAFFEQYQNRNEHITPLA